MKGSLLLFLIVALTVVNNVSATTWYVDPIKSDNETSCGETPQTACETLRLALGRAQDNDKILIASGVTLTGPDNENLVVTQKSLIISSGAGSSPFSVIEGSGGAEPLLTYNGGLTDQPHFEGLKFRGGIVVLGEGAASFQSCRFEGTGLSAGIVYSGRPAQSGLTMLGLTVADSVFAFSSVVIKNGTMKMQGCQFDAVVLTPAIMATGAVNLDVSTTFLSQSGSFLFHHGTNSGSVSVADCQFRNNGPTGSLFDVKNVTLFVLQGSQIFQSNELVLENVASALISTTSFKSIYQEATLDLLNTNVTLSNCTFESVFQAPAIVCDRGVVLSVDKSCEFRNNQNSGGASLVQARAGCQVKLPVQSFNEAQNSMPLISCQDSSLSGGSKGFAASVTCASGCSWEYCQKNGPQAYVIAMLVVGIVAIMVLLAVFARWWWTTYGRKQARRLEYSNIQNDSDQEML